MITKVFVLRDLRIPPWGEQPKYSQSPALSKTVPGSKSL
ncbi:hypothetical protein L291_4442 [Acinetobacter guillouiae MSP4-18]|nr:hypothetical protein L291_4442 [Acinetobacter guillouiae MSP4-18]